MIVIDHLTKIYKLNKKQQKELKTKDTIKKAVDDLSLEIPDGEIFGLLGQMAPEKQPHCGVWRHCLNRPKAVFW